MAAMRAPLTDTEALRRNRRRALSGPVSFLHARAAADVAERLCATNRDFERRCVVSPMPAPWLEAIPGARAVAEGDALEFGPGAWDLIVHALCLHWSNDPLGQLIQSRRALRPDGLFLAVLFGGRTLHELRSCLAQAESDLSGGLSPRVIPMGEIRDLGALLQRAEFAMPVADSVPVTATYASALHLMRELRMMGEANAMQARTRRPTRRSVVLRACEIYDSAFGGADGRVPATFELIVLTGWAPSQDQPRPCRPGSAKTRLADALGTRETPLADAAAPPDPGP